MPPRRALSVLEGTHRLCAVESESAGLPGKCASFSIRPAPAWTSTKDPSSARTKCPLRASTQPPRSYWHAVHLSEAFREQQRSASFLCNHNMPHTSNPSLLLQTPLHTPYLNLKRTPLSPLLYRPFTLATGRHQTLIHRPHPLFWPSHNDAHITSTLPIAHIAHTSTILSIAFPA